MDGVVLYTLIVVTLAGNVSQTPGFKSLDLCKEAAQVATNGKTVAEEKAASELHAEESRRLEQECRDRQREAGKSSYLCPLAYGVALPSRWTNVQFARCLIDPEGQRR